MKKIKYNGQEVEAYALIMRKENALEILEGRKTVEFRFLSDKYQAMFVDKSKLENNERLRKEGRDAECDPIVRTDVEAIHFYSTGADWHLDVSIDDIGMGEMTEEFVKFLHKEYDCHEFDEEWQQYKDLPKEEIPIFFYLHIDGIISHSGLK